MEAMEIDKDKGELRLMIDTKFYGYLAVVRAAYMFTRTCYVSLDGDPSDKVLVGLKPKNTNLPLENFGHEFYNCMLEIIRESISSF